MHPTSKISDVGWNVGCIWWNVGCIWELSKYRKKQKRRKKIMLHDIGWSLLSIKLFIQHFLVHPTMFSCWMHFSSFWFIILPFNSALSAKHLQWSVFRTFKCFFHNQNTKKSIFRQLQARQKETEVTTCK